MCSQPALFVSFKNTKQLCAGKEKRCAYKNQLFYFRSLAFQLLNKTFDPLPAGEVTHARYSYGVKEQRVKREMSTKQK